MSRNLLECAAHPGKSHKNGSEIPEYGWKTKKITFPIFRRPFQEFTPSDMPHQYDFLAAPERSPLWPYFLFLFFSFFAAVVPSKSAPTRVLWYQTPTLAADIRKSQKV